MSASQTAGSAWWSSDGFSRSDQTDLWQKNLCSAYQDWTVLNENPKDFSAKIRQQSLGDGLRLIECITTPCSGQRLKSNLSKDCEPYLGVQLTFSGRENFRCGSQVKTYGAGDLFVWLSDKEMKFEVTENLHKSTLMIPCAQIKERLPRDTVLNSTVIDGTTRMGAMLNSHLACLTNHEGAFDVSDNSTIKRITLELVTSCLGHSLDHMPNGLSQQYLRGAQNYILDNLQDENMTPGNIAHANRISVRYLHMIFEQTGQTVSSWIREMRLQRCRDSLESGRTESSRVSDIAYQWGFNDASHFSRAFKNRFGVSPKQFRHDAGLVSGASK